VVEAVAAEEEAAAALFVAPVPEGVVELMAVRELLVSAAGYPAVRLTP